jgi:hypothetical protein
MFKEIKWAWQRVVRRYDDRIFWSFDSYFITMIEPLKKFCSEELADEKHMELNPERKSVFEETIKLIDIWEHEEYEAMFNGTNITKLATHFGKNINYFWD